MYGGGMGELGIARGQVELLASLFHPDADNDVAPSAFNAPELDRRLAVEPARAAGALAGLPADLIRRPYLTSKCMKSSAAPA